MSEFCGHGIIGELRYPAAPGVCGPVRVLSVEVDGDTAEAVLTLAAGTAFHDGDTVIVAGVDAEINGTQTVTVIAANELRINGSDGTDIDYTSGGTVDAPNQVNQYWNETPPDNWRKGRFTVKQWHCDFRGFFESLSDQRYAAQINSAEPDCPAITPIKPIGFTVCEGVDLLANTPFVCGPGSLWLSNFEDREGGIKHSADSPNCVYVGPPLAEEEKALWSPKTVFVFFQAMDLDDQYGSLHLIRVDQWMEDPFYEPFGRNWQGLRCTEASVIVMDDGTCKLDNEETGKRYFPFSDQEESRAAVPGGAPILPADVEIGCPHFIDRLNGAAVGEPKSICYPPYAWGLEYSTGDDDNCKPGYRLHGEPVDRFLPWVVENNEEGCVNAGGRFADDYRANGVWVPA